ncbi:MAG: zinc-ribbon domain-containing protein [Burkholderiaceae bacterium]|nr:zinc-ribbon domain-containing protein [Burkholderiaceae bacterium]
MSLATRCTSCNTVFRVVQDQLKVSEGWVRCGRCHEVFNALESLFDLEPAASAATDSPAQTEEGEVASYARAEPGPSAEPSAASQTSQQSSPTPPEADTPWDESTAPAQEPQAIDQVPAASPDSPAAAPPYPPWPSAPVPAPHAPADALAEAGFHALSRVAAPAATPSQPPNLAPVDEDDDDAEPPAWAVADNTPAVRLDARDRHDFADARFFSSDLPAEESVAAPDAMRVEGPDEAIEPERPADLASDGPPQAPATPEFLRRAERRARWNRPGVVAAMAVVCAALLLGLAAQAALHFRDLAAATWPAARPALEALCETAGCRIEPVRRIDDIVIESSALTGAPSGDAVRLSIVLRNRGTLPLAMPSIELTLTDVGGQMLARRALTPAEFGTKGATLPAASETPLQLVLAVSGRRPSGYTVEPFYP